MSTIDRVPARDLRVGDRVGRKARVEALHVRSDGRVLARIVVQGARPRAVEVWGPDDLVTVYR